MRLLLIWSFVTAAFSAASNRFSPYGRSFLTFPPVSLPHQHRSSFHTHSSDERRNTASSSEYDSPRSNYFPPEPTYSPPRRKYVAPSSSSEEAQLESRYSLPHRNRDPSSRENSEEYERPRSNYSPPKPSYSPPRSRYDTPSSSSTEESNEYERPRSNYSPPKPSYSPPRTRYDTPSSSSTEESTEYERPRSNYSPPKTSYSPPRSRYDAPSSSSREESNEYERPRSNYSPPKPSYSPPRTRYDTPSSSSTEEDTEYEIPSESYSPPRRSYLTPRPKYSSSSTSDEVEDVYEVPRRSYSPPSSKYQSSTSISREDEGEYDNPQPSYTPPRPKYSPPSFYSEEDDDDFDSPESSYSPPNSEYSPPKNAFVSPTSSGEDSLDEEYSPPSSNYSPPRQTYGAPSPFTRITDEEDDDSSEYGNEFDLDSLRKQVAKILSELGSSEVLTALRRYTTSGSDSSQDTYSDELSSTYGTPTRDHMIDSILREFTSQEDSGEIRRIGLTRQYNAPVQSGFRISSNSPGTSLYDGSNEHVGAYGSLRTYGTPRRTNSRVTSISQNYKPPHRFNQNRGIGSIQKLRLRGNGNFNPSNVNQGRVLFRNTGEGRFKLLDTSQEQITGNLRSYGTPKRTNFRSSNNPTLLYKIHLPRTSGLNQRPTKVNSYGNPQSHILSRPKTNYNTNPHQTYRPPLSTSNKNLYHGHTSTLTGGTRQYGQSRFPNYFNQHPLRRTNNPRRGRFTQARNFGGNQKARVYRDNRKNLRSYRAKENGVTSRKHDENFEARGLSDFFSFLHSLNLD